MFRFELLDPQDSMMKEAHKVFLDRLVCRSKIGGVVRFEGDVYYKTHPEVPGNPWVITTLWLAQYYIRLAEKVDEIGMVTGLSVTEAGGEVLFIEVTLMPGKGNLLLTGQLGDVMKESGQAAMSYVRAHWADLGLPEKFFHKVDVHVHVPEGAIPKDGPSAGIALTTAIVSAFTKIPVHKEVAMTGEVTLRGRVLEIGGFKEKVLAAHRAGVKIVIAPSDNEKDLEDIPDYVQKDLKFIFVKHMDDVLKVALVRPPQPAARKRIPVPPPVYMA